MTLVPIHCRPGFEKECAAEIMDLAGRHGCPGYVRAIPGEAMVRFESPDAEALQQFFAAQPFSQLVFARQWFIAGPELAGLTAGGRAEAIAARLSGVTGGYRDLWIETTDTNEGKSLSRLARSLAGPVRRELQRLSVWHPDEPDLPRAQVLLLAGDRALVGWSNPANAAPWPMGIPRLRLPRGAPSRAVLKLEEALHQFLSRDEMNRLLREGRTAVDLGAAPGGWTWLLARRGLQVTAVDNGALLPELARSPQVEHLRADGFTYRPDHPVHWLVCDMVEKPRRIADLVAGWYGDGLCERAIFNLKLPMKRRYDEVRICADRIARQLAERDRPFTLRIRHLYHDREEVTACLGPP